jgi:hypothetical protein
MRALLLLCTWSLLFNTVAAAQDAPAPGVRAAGMGGAFTAVADDGSAVYWNPGGLASGSFFSLVLDHNAQGDGNATLLTLGTPPLGLSYYRTATGPAAADRNSLVADHAGVTFVQSLADRIAVGATVKVVRGTARAGSGPAVSSTKVDADLGLMLMGALGRIGLSVHNVAAPSFATTGDAIPLERRVRGGISLNTGRLTTVAADLEFTTTHRIADGRPWREAALGVETHPRRKVWLRGGVHWNTAGDTAAPIGSVGGSYAVYGSTVADAQVSFGSEEGNNGWGVGLRFVF